MSPGDAGCLNLWPSFCTFLLTFSKALQGHGLVEAGTASPEVAGRREKNPALGVLRRVTHSQCRDEKKDLLRNWVQRLTRVLRTRRGRTQAEGTAFEARHYAAPMPACTAGTAEIGPVTRSWRAWWTMLKGLDSAL